MSIHLDDGEEVVYEGDGEEVDIESLLDIDGLLQSAPLATQDQPGTSGHAGDPTANQVDLQNQGGPQGSYPIAAYEEPQPPAAPPTGALLPPMVQQNTASSHSSGGMPPDSGPCRWEDLRLVIISHSVHKVNNENTPEREYVVSNLRSFTIEVSLVNKDDNSPVPNNLALRAQLYYENGNIVRQSHENEQLLQGDTEVMVIQGRGKFTLKMGPNALSNKLGRQRFRVRIEPRNEELRGHELLSVLTEPLRSVTKLERRNAAQRAAANAAAAQPAASHDNYAAASPPGGSAGMSPQFHTTPPPNVAPRVGDSGGIGSGICSGGGGSLDGGGSGGGIPAVGCGGGMVGNGGGGGACVSAPHCAAQSGSTLGQLQQQIDAERESERQKSAEIEQLRQELDLERTNNMSIKEALALQQKQLQELQSSNALILAQLARINGARSVAPPNSRPRHATEE